MHARNSVQCVCGWKDLQNRHPICRRKQTTARFSDHNDGIQTSRPSDARTIVSAAAHVPTGGRGESAGSVVVSQFTFSSFSPIVTPVLVAPSLDIVRPGQRSSELTVSGLVGAGGAPRTTAGPAPSADTAISQCKCSAGVHEIEIANSNRNRDFSHRIAVMTHSPPHRITICLIKG